ncbi:MAG: glycosyltransferase [Alphaproteobacteria bacterium]|nr:glycosyltransferase [Alphaproteobacteria bacterium]
MHVITGLGVGGAEAQLGRLLLAGGRFAHGASVVSLTAGGAWAGRLRAAGIPVVELGMARGRPNGAALAALTRLVRVERPAVVQGWMYHANVMATVALFLAARRRSTRLIWGIRASDLDPAAYGRSFRVALRLSAWLARVPDVVSANAQAAIAAHEAHGVRPRRWAVVPNGVDGGAFRPDAAARVAVRQDLGIPRDAPVVIHVARLDPMKDHATLFAALDRVAGVHTIIVGLGTETLEPRPTLYRLGLRDDVARLMAAADVFVSSSAYGEGFSNALAEAMATGLVPVATDMGDARAIVGETGFVVPPRDPVALARAIGAALAEPVRGAAARARVLERFTIAAAAERFVAIQDGA